MNAICLEDKEIMDSILRKGNRQAYAEIVRRYSGLVYSRAMGVVKNDDWASLA